MCWLIYETKMDRENTFKKKPLSHYTTCTRVFSFVLLSPPPPLFSWCPLHNRSLLSAIWKVSNDTSVFYLTNSTYAQIRCLVELEAPRLFNNISTKTAYCKIIWSMQKSQVFASGNVVWNMQIQKSCSIDRLRKSLIGKSR